MVRVTDVLGSAEAVSSTVDSASRLAYRAFANPVVKTVAFSTGLRGALRRLFGRPLPVAGRGAPRPPGRHAARPVGGALGPGAERGRAVAGRSR